MPVAAYAEKLEVYAARFFNGLFVITAFFYGVIRHAVEHVSVFTKDIYVIKKIFIHKISVTLVVSFRYAEVFIKVVGCNP